MFEAFTVAIRLSLTNGISGGLSSIIHQFGVAQGRAAAFKKELQGVKLLALSGAAIGGTGLAGLNMLGKTLPYAKEYAHQLALMNVSGMKQVEIAKSVKAAWATTNAVPTTTAAENLAGIRELRMVFRNSDDAIKALPTVQKIQGVLSTVKGVSNAHDEAYTVAKALEMKGASRDPAEFAKEADLMTRAIIASGGKLTANDFLAQFIGGRRATQKWSDEFAYTILPTLMQEMKGSGGGGTRGPGNGLMSTYAAVVGGTIAQKALPLWSKLGLLDRSKVVWTKSGEMKGVRPGGVKGSDLFQESPYLWAQNVLLPAFQRQHMNDKEMHQALQYLFPNRTTTLIDQLTLQKWKFDGDQKIIQGTEGLSAYKKLLDTDPEMASVALHKQWQNVLALIGYSIMPTLVRWTRELIPVLQSWAAWMRKHPALVKAAVVGFAGLMTAMAAFGSFLIALASFKAFGILFKMLGGAGKLIGPLAGVFRWLVAVGGAIGEFMEVLGLLLGAVTLPAWGVVAAIAAGVVGLGVAIWQLWKHWGQVWPILKNMGAWLGNALKNVCKTIGTFLAGIVTGFTSFFGRLWDAFKNSPIGRAVAGVVGGIMGGVAGGGNAPHVAPPSHPMQSGKVGDVYMDGRKVGALIADHLGRATGGVATGGGLFDPSMHLAYVGQGGL